MAGCRFQLRRSFMSTPRLRTYLYSIFTGKFEGVFAFNWMMILQIGLPRYLKNN